MPLSVSSLNAYTTIAPIAFLGLLLLLYLLRWRHDNIHIMQVLTILLINEGLYACFELLAYLNDDNTHLCEISIIGRMAFLVAANFWIIFITRLVYRQALTPGKYFDLVHFVLKNVVFTYIPSLALGTFLIVMLYVSDTTSEIKCWKIITSTQALNYVIYGMTFILPNLVCFLAILWLLFQTFRLKTSRCSLFLAYPVFALIFTSYYLFVKVYQFLNTAAQMEYLNMALEIEPITYGVLYVLVYRRMRRSSIKGGSGSISLGGSEGEVSLVDE